ncbi:MAG: hypothetical protein IJI43_01080 [Bacilli bacterium]|nr:hypothetical protein [Bacilli bacterium]
MAKNSKGQTVSNKKYYKKDTKGTKKTTTKKATATKKTTTKKTTAKKTTPKKVVKKTVTKSPKTTKKVTTKKVTPKKTTTTKKKSTVKKATPKKIETVKKIEDVVEPKVEEKELAVEKKALDNNVSIVVDDKPEKLDSYVLEDVKISKVKSNAKIKTEFDDDLLEEVKDQDIVDEAFKEKEEDINDKDKLREEIAYNGFIIRLIVFVLILILSIFFVIKFCVQYINTSPMKDVSYFESSDVSYSLCTGNDCNEDVVITNSVDKVKINYAYDVNFDDIVSYNINYKVLEKFTITDKGSAVVKTNNKESISTGVSKSKTDKLELKKNYEVNVNKYRKELEDYVAEKDAEFNGNLVVTLIVSGLNKEKEVAKVTIPMGEDKVETSVISSSVSDSLFRDDTMNNYSNLYVILFVASLVVVIAACIGIVILVNRADVKGDE